MSPKDSQENVLKAHVLRFGLEKGTDLANIFRYALTETELNSWERSEFMQLYRRRARMAFLPIS